MQNARTPNVFHSQNPETVRYGKDDGWVYIAAKHQKHYVTSSLSN